MPEREKIVGDEESEIHSLLVTHQMYCLIG